MSITAAGGYQILDFKNIPIFVQADNVTVKPDSSIIGAFEQYGKKPFVLYNVHTTTTDHSIDDTRPLLIAFEVYAFGDNTYEIETNQFFLIISPDTMYWTPKE